MNQDKYTAMGKPADYAPILNSVMWLQVAIATLFIGLRLYTRYFIIRCLGWDDLIMVVNLVRCLCRCHDIMLQESSQQFNSNEHRSLSSVS